jgi:site-specific DNA-methyltransferase (cytosine-N4-specific)
MVRNKFTYGDQFSPEKIIWSDLLNFIKVAAGNREKLKSLIGNKYFKPSGKNQKTMALNTTLTLNSYGLINIVDHNYTPTELYENIVSCKSDDERYVLFAKHILINLEGLILIRCIDSMKNRGDELTLENINYELQELGYEISPSCTYVSTMKAWLNIPLMIIEKNYDINWDNVSKLVGIEKDFIEDIYEIGIEQKYFLMSLLALDAVTYENASTVANHTRNVYRVKLTTKMLVKNILEPLVSKELIEVQKTTGGRGAKSHKVKLTDIAINTLKVPMIQRIADLSGFSPIFLNKPFESVVNDLNHPSIHTRGKALELLAIWFIRLLDLRFTGWRKRDKETGGAEVDVMAANDKIVFNRWQIQCKNTNSTVGVEVVAKEVGLTFLTKADVVMIVTTSSFSQDAIKYTNEVLSSSRYYIILIDGKDLQVINKNKSAIVDILNSKARQVFNRREGRDALNHLDQRGKNGS